MPDSVPCVIFPQRQNTFSPVCPPNRGGCPNPSPNPPQTAARLAALFWRSPTVAQSKSATKSAKKSSPRSMKKASAKAMAEFGADAVTIDRRRGKVRRDGEEGTDESATTAAPILERRKKVNRRRQIDPTTCERDYSEPEVEFMNALDEYKRKSGRMFPTCSEVLEVIQSLGYVKMSPTGYQIVLTTDAVSAKPMPAGLPASSTQDVVTETV